MPNYKGVYLILYLFLVATTSACFFFFSLTRTAESSYLPTTGSNIGIGTSTPVGGLVIMNGNTGIGTWSPTSKLQVVGTVAATAFSGDGSALTNLPGGASGWTDGGTNVYTSTTTDLVAIGTTTPASALTVKGNVGIGTTTPYTTIAAPANGMVVEGNVGIGTFAANSGKLVVMGGNVGIGMNSPSHPLEVLGVGKFSQLSVGGNIGSGLVMALIESNSQSSYATLLLNDNQAGANTFSDMIFGSAGGYNGRMRGGRDGNDNGYLSFYTETTEKVRIDSAGNVGIGTALPVGALTVMNGNAGIGTWSPTSKLQVVGTVAATAFSGDGSALTNLPASGGWTDGGTNVYTSTTTDNVGIGTTTPNAATFEIVKNAAQPVLKVSSSAAGGGNYLIVNSQGNVGVGTIAPVGAMTVMSGNLGIGTWSPEALLTVRSGTSNAYIDSSGKIFTNAVAQPGVGASIDVVGVSSNDAVIRAKSVAGKNAYFWLDRGGVGDAADYAFVTAGVQQWFLGPLRDSSESLAIRTAGNAGDFTGTARLVVTTGGNVGIGTTSPVGALTVMNGNAGIGTWSPTQRLQVVGTVAATAFTGDGSGLTGLPGGGGWTDGGTNVYTSTTTDSVGIGTTTPRGALVVMNGNVGIGTVGPEYPLVIQGNTTAGVQGPLYLKSIDGIFGVGFNMDATNSGGRVYSITSAGSGFNLPGGYAIYDTTGGQYVFSITTDGKTGIGSIDGQGLTAGSKLSVKGSAGVGTNYFLTAAPSEGLIVEGNVGIGTWTANSKIVVKGGVGIGTVSSSTFINTAAPSGGLIVENNVGIGTSAPVGALTVMNGNVGIGTWSPTSKLQVVGTVAATAFSGDGSGLTGVSASPSGIAGSVQFSNGTALASDNSNLFWDDTNNRLGIGTASPTSSALLTVNGAISMTGSALILGDTTGNARGAGALDIQVSRSSASQVASNQASIAVGANNTVTAGSLATGPAAAFGYGNTVGSNYYGLALGTNNIAGIGGGASPIAIGFGNSISNAWDNALAVGVSNTINTHGGKAIGDNNMITGTSAIAIGNGITNSVANSLQIGPSDSSKVTILSTGNVGLGTAIPVGALTVMNGNVGIGTWSPTQRLQVVGTVAATAFSGDGSGLTGISAGGWTDGGTNVYTSTTTDNVGIGTTTPLAPLHIIKDPAGGPFWSTIILQPAAGFDSAVGLESRRNSTTQQWYFGSGSGANPNTNNFRIVDITAGNFDAFNIAPGGNVGIGTIAPRAALSVMNGNVGIGTTSPLSAFQVTSTTAPQVRILAPSAGTATLSLFSSSVLDWTVNGDTNFTVKRDAIQVLMIDGNANVGIGQLTPINKLEVPGAATMGAYAGTVTAPSNGLIVSGNVGIGTMNASNGALIVAGNVGIGTVTPVGALTVMNGNVGIGTWSPTSKLQVVGTIAATAFTGDGSGLTGISAGGWTDGGTNVFTSTTTDNVAIGTTTPVGALTVKGGVGIGTITPYTTIAPPANGLIVNGNVGIGTWAPSAILDVVGVGDSSFSSNVGIGTISPAYSLEVIGTGRFSGTVTANAFVGDGSGLTGIAGGSGGWTDGGTNVYASTTTDNVGIGTTTPTAALMAQNAGTQDSFRINDSVLDGSPFIIDSVGNVGIGTTSSANQLSIYSSTNNAGLGIHSTWGLAAINLTSYTGNYFNIENAGGILRILSSYTATYPFQIELGAPTGALYVKSDGNVGMGTTNPVGALTVMNGNVGIGTWSPIARAEIKGSIISTAITNSGSTIDFATGNLQYTSVSCGALTLNNMKSGGTYSLAVQGAAGGTCSFTAYSGSGAGALTVKADPVSLVQTATKHVIFSFMVMGSTVYVGAVDGY